MKNWHKIIMMLVLLAFAASCRNDPSPQKPMIEKIVFGETAKTVLVGDVVKIDVKVEPAEAKKNGKIIYKTTDAGIIEIKEESGNDGVVFEGLKRGSTVITATAGGIADYCVVTVSGVGESVIPHIVVPEYVIECRENERRSIVASLVGGTPLDDNGFVWSYTNQRVLTLESRGSIGVFDTMSLGESIVTISHPKAQCSIDVLVYVLGSDEAPVYINTDSNVINLEKTDNNYQFQVDLRGGDTNDYYGFVFEVLDGSNIIDLRYNNNIGTINPKTPGVARIGVSHSKAVHRLEIIVIVNENVVYSYIDVDKTLVIMDEGYREEVTAVFFGNAPHDIDQKYSFEIEDETVINVIKFNNVFNISGLKKGKSVLKIKNEYADFDRQVLIIVNGESNIVDNEIYISTNQNVITMEAGGDEALLIMMLVGGNEADKNNFMWTVDDSTIISVETGHGKVEYDDLRGRSIMNTEREKFEAQAIIKAKKVGTARITLENPKAKNSFSVIVKVYKKSVFGVLPVVLEGPSVCKIGIGEQLSLQLGAAAGNAQNVSNVVWTSEDGNIASVTGTGLTGMLQGKSSGITNVTVRGSNLKYEHRIVVIVGDNDYLNEVPYMYVRSPFISVIKDKSVQFRIECERMSTDEINGISVVNNSGDLIDVFSFRNNVVVTGLQLGEAEIIISGSGLNTFKVVVMVEEYEINPDMPYYLRSPKVIYGVAKGKNIEITADLTGGNALNERSIVWDIEDDSVAAISGNGSVCLVDGKNVGQTIITVNHPKSINKLEIIIYVAENDADVDNKVIVYVKEKNILMGEGEARYISIVTNANDAQRNNFRWSISDFEIIEANVGSDRLEAYVSAKSVGNATITVSHSTSAMPTVIYVSVINKAYNNKFINAPAIIEMVLSDSVSINAVTNEIFDKHNIIWSIEDDDIALIYGNGDSCLINALKGGDTVITIEYEGLGFKKNILLFVYNNIEQMTNRYVMAGEQSRYVIGKGDIINIGLVFGIKGYPEHEINNIIWEESKNNVIEVTGSGKTAAVRGVNGGIGKIIVNSSIANTVEIEVEVREDNAKAGEYWFSINAQDKIKGILTGEYADITVRVFKGNNEVFNISGIEYEVQDGNIIGVEANGNSIRVLASNVNEGQSYITIRHDMVEDARILIYTASTSYGLEIAYPLMVDKTNYLLGKGDSITVAVVTKDNDHTKINNISYDLERGNGIITVAGKSKRELVVNAQNTGSDVILIRYNGAVALRVYVSVTEKNYGLNAGYLVTENIIGLVLGDEYTTTVNTNLSGAMYWSGTNDITAIQSVSGKSAVLKGLNIGESSITVKAGNLERNIAVFVCATEEEVRRYETVNIEQNYYSIKKNENVNITIFSYQGKVEGQTVYADYYGYGDLYGNVIQINTAENGKLSIKGINEGVAAIRVSNAYYGFSKVVYVEVSNSIEGNIGINDSRSYITAEKTLYVIGLAEENILVNVDVIGGRFYGAYDWIWSGYDSSIIDVSYGGFYAYINPKREGRTEIKVSNAECMNDLSITIIVGERYTADSSLLPYIYVEKDVYGVSKDTKTMSIYYNIINVPNIIENNIFVMSSGGSITVKRVQNGVIDIDIHDVGMGKIDITYEGLSREVYILVTSETEYGNAYLTTSENYIIMSNKELRQVNIRLVGHDEFDAGRFTWNISNSNILEAVGNGLAGQFYAKGIGDAVVTINYNHPVLNIYPLQIYVKVVEDKTKANMVYLTTQRNVVETVMGDTVEVLNVLKIGGSVDKRECTWTVDNSSVVSLTGNSYSAQFTPKNIGVAEVTVTNVENPNYKLKIVIIVRQASGSVFIQSNETLLLFRPHDMQKRISVSLENGDIRDNNLFRWTIDTNVPSNQSVAQANGKVISIVGSNEECFITPLNEGKAVIRVENSKAAGKPLFITAYVTYYETIQFSVQNKTIITGDSEWVAINLPTYEYMSNKVEVTSNKNEICSVIATNDMVLLKGNAQGSAIVTARVAGREGVAELFVTVEDEIDSNINRVLVSNTMYNLNLKSPSFYIDAQLVGQDITDLHQDGITWTVKNEGSADVIDIFPLSKTGRQVRITPKKLGQVILTVNSDFAHTGYSKDICIMIGEANQQFRVSNNIIELNRGKSETVSASITGGTTKDYANIKWTAELQKKWDGTMIEVVRVMGSGKEVSLYPINNGHTKVYVVFEKYIEVIEVDVVTEYYFDFYSSNEYMYPGQVKNVKFEVRPKSSTIQWINNNYNQDNLGPIISYSEVLGSGATGDSDDSFRYLQIKALREGQTSLMGMTNGNAAALNIVVEYDYKFTMFTEVIGVPKHAMPGSSNDGKVVKKRGYTIYPPDTYIKATSPIPEGLIVEIMKPEIETDALGNEIGVGTIVFTADREMFIEEFEFTQFKKKLFASDPEEAIPDKTRKAIIMYRFAENRPPVIPYFVEGRGVWSNRDVAGNKFAVYSRFDGSPSNGTRLGGSSNKEITNSTYNFDLGDGEEHYIVFDKRYYNLFVDNFRINDNSPAGTSRIDLGDGVEAYLTTLNVNGTNEVVLAISGGEDYIEYTRAALDKELLVEVASKHYTTTGEVPIKNKSLAQKSYYSSANGITYYAYDEIVMYDNNYMTFNAGTFSARSNFKELTAAEMQTMKTAFRRVINGDSANTTNIQNIRYYDSNNSELELKTNSNGNVQDAFTLRYSLTNYTIQEPDYDLPVKVSKYNVFKGKYEDAAGVRLVSLQGYNNSLPANAVLYGKQSNVNLDVYNDKNDGYFAGRMYHRSRSNNGNNFDMSMETECFLYDNILIQDLYQFFSWSHNYTKTGSINGPFPSNTDNTSTKGYIAAPFVNTRSERHKQVGAGPSGKEGHSQFRTFTTNVIPSAGNYPPQISTIYSFNYVLRWNREGFNIFLADNENLFYNSNSYEGYGENNYRENGYYNLASTYAYVTYGINWDSIDSRGIGWAYSSNDIGATQKLIWRDIAKGQVIVPRKILNKFPFRYKVTELYKQYGNTAAVVGSYLDVVDMRNKSIPWPSSNTSYKTGEKKTLSGRTVKSGNKTLVVNFNYYDFGDYQDSAHKTGTITINLNYKVRACSYMYNGENLDNKIHYTGESAISEYPGQSLIWGMGTANGGGVLYNEKMRQEVNADGSYYGAVWD